MCCSRSSSLMPIPRCRAAARLLCRDDQIDIRESLGISSASTRARLTSCALPGHASGSRAASRLIIVSGEAIKADHELAVGVDGGTDRAQFVVRLGGRRNNESGAAGLPLQRHDRRELRNPIGKRKPGIAARELLGFDRLECKPLRSRAACIRTSNTDAFALTGCTREDHGSGHVHDCAEGRPANHRPPGDASIKRALSAQLAPWRRSGTPVREDPGCPFFRRCDLGAAESAARACRPRSRRATTTSGTGTYGVPRQPRTRPRTNGSSRKHRCDRGGRSARATGGPCTAKLDRTARPVSRATDKDNEVWRHDEAIHLQWIFEEAQKPESRDRLRGSARRRSQEARQGWP